MSIFVFMLVLAEGVVASLPAARVGEAGRAFRLFCLGLALSLAASATLLRALGPALWGAAPALALTGASLLGWSCFVAALLLPLGLELAGRGRVWALLAAAVVGAVALLIDAVGIHATASSIPAVTLLHQLNLLSGGWLVGSVLVAMILGHYYLVMPGSSIDPLKRAFVFSFAALLVRCLLLLLVGVLWWTHVSDPLGTPAQQLNVGLFVALRLLFGLLLPLSLAWFTWQTILLRATQSATGILYVVVFATLVGEALSVFLSIDTGVPL